MSEPANDPYSRPEDVVHLQNRLGRGRFGDAGPLNKGGGGSGYDGMTGWPETVERRLGELRGDIRLLLTLFIGGFVLLMSAFGVGYLLLSGQIDGVTKDVHAVATNVAVLRDRSDRALRSTSTP